MDDIFNVGQRTTLTAVFTSVCLAAVKAIVGFISGSVVLLGDAVHSFADSFSSFAVWIGLRIARKKPTEKFPYGFYKAESIAALVVSYLILFAGYSIIKESIGKLFIKHSLFIPLLALATAVVDAIAMFLMGTYEARKGREINSQSLIADGKESRMHILSSSVVLLGILSVMFKIPYLEGVSGIIISLFIFQVGIGSAKDSIFSLMDVSPDPAVEEEIKAVLDSISGLKGFENLKLRKSGPFIFGEVTARVKKMMSVKETQRNLTKLRGR